MAKTIDTCAACGEAIGKEFAIYSLLPGEVVAEHGSCLMLGDDIPHTVIAGPWCDDGTGYTVNDVAHDTLKDALNSTYVQEVTRG